MQQIHDYYTILEVTKNATAEEIKASFRKLLENIILMLIQEIKHQKKNLKVLMKLIISYQMKLKEQIIIV